MQVADPPGAGVSVWCCFLPADSALPLGPTPAAGSVLHSVGFFVHLCTSGVTLG